MSAPWDSPNHAICPECGFTASDKEKPNSGWFECQCGTAFAEEAPSGAEEIEFVKPKEPSWASLEGLKQAVNDLISANDRLFGEVDRLRSERDMYWEYWLAANDLHHLEESLGAGVPIPNGSRDKAVESINMIRSRIEEWQNDL